MKNMQNKHISGHVKSSKRTCLLRVLLPMFDRPDLTLLRLHMYKSWFTVVTCAMYKIFGKSAKAECGWWLTATWEQGQKNELPNEIAKGNIRHCFSFLPLGEVNILKFWACTHLLNLLSFLVFEMRYSIINEPWVALTKENYNWAGFSRRQSKTALAPVSQSVNLYLWI